MRTVLLIVFILFLLFAAPVATRAADTWTGPPVVVTTGTGEMRVAPDRATVTLTSEARAKTAKDAQQQEAQSTAAVRKLLADMKIPNESVRTTSYDLQPEFDYANGKQTLRGYVARNQVQVRVDAIDRVGELLEVAIGSGATSVSGVRFDLKDSARFERDALRLAVTDARQKADTAASAAGRTVDRVLRVEEHGVVSRPPMPFVAAAREVAQADTPPIAPGQMEFHSEVTITVELK